MDNNTFTLHKLNNPHLTFTLIDSKFIPIEKTYFDIADKRINNQQIELLEEWN